MKIKTFFRISCKHLKKNSVSEEDRYLNSQETKNIIQPTSILPILVPEISNYQNK